MNAIFVFDIICLFLFLFFLQYNLEIRCAFKSRVYPLGVHLLISIRLQVFAAFNVVQAQLPNPPLGGVFINETLIMNLYIQYQDTLFVYRVQVS